MSSADIASMIKIEQLGLFKEARGISYRDASVLFDLYKVWDFIDDMYEEMHMQGDMVSFDEIEEYLRRLGGLAV
jgi:hypothetical protein